MVEHFKEFKSTDLMFKQFHSIRQLCSWAEEDVNVLRAAIV